MENKPTKEQEQELDMVGRYVAYTLNNIDNFERRIKKEKKNGKQADKRTN